MFVLIEIQCKDWEHNRVNAGFIRHLSNAFPNEAIKLYGEVNHIKGVEDILCNSGVKIETVAIDFFDYHGKNEDRANDYADIIESIIRENPKENKYVLMSCNKGIILAMSDIARNHYDIRFEVILHSALEEVVAGNKGLSLLRQMHLFFHALRHGQTYKKADKTVLMRDCLEKCINENCRFIVYSPNYKEGLKGRLDDRIIEKIAFVNHPCYESIYKHKINDESKVIIGVYGQAVNDNAISIIKRYNATYDNGNIEFRVKTTKDSDLLRMKNVAPMFSNEYVSNEELEKTISAFDYIMIPYDRGQYIVSASGIFFDAVSQRIPLITLDSPFFRYYFRYDIGVMSESCSGLAEILPNLRKDEELDAKYRNGMDSLYDSIMGENSVLLETIFKKQF